VETGMSKARTREDEMAVISAQNQAEVAQLEHEILEHEILGQESNEGKASNDEISKVCKSSPSLKHYVHVVPSPKTFTEVESKDSPCTEVKPGIVKEYVFQDVKGNIYTDSSMDRQAVSYEYSPLCTISKSLPVKNRVP